MADLPNWPCTLAGQRLRRTAVVARREGHRRRRLLALVALTAASLATSAYWNVPLLFVWNASASAPIGLYSVSRESTVRKGDMVVAWVPAAARSLAASRGYVPIDVPLVKRVAAAGTDQVCARGADISINGRLAATRLEQDPSGRPMPWWAGCRTLRPGDVFLLMEGRLSFDGRYFGISRASDVVGRAKLLWAL